jgi:probable rRNA maturation factor
MVLFVLKTYEANCEEVNVHLVSKKTITKLHEDFFQDPTPTDCITFPFAEDSLLGEIFICPEVAIEYANKYKKDPHQETSLYIVHALLHLLGFDDI